MTDSDRELRLEELIAEFLQSQDAGIPPDRDAILVAHPELADDLRAFFREHDRVARLAAPLRAAGLGPSIGTDATLGLESSGASPSDATIHHDARRSAGTLTDATEYAPHGGNGMTLARGATVRYFGDYEIGRELGRGGMGVVYEATQVSLNRPVALKMLKVGALADELELQRFQNEAEAVAMLDHAAIVPVYEVGEHEGQRYFSMKLVEGGNLADRLDSFKDSPRAAVALIIEAAEAVRHAHMRGVLHRDLKPANILIDAQGRPHVTDFGLAKRIGGDVEMTQSGAILGTPAYMSPEQAAGRRGSITTATDVYGLGAIFYALLTGRAPFGGDSVVETLDAVRTRVPDAPSRSNATIPRDLELICLKCLEKNPVDRYPTAGDLADDLRRWTAGEPVGVRAAGAVERLAKWARRKPTLAAAYSLALLALLLGGLGGSAAWQWRVAARARDVAATAKASAEQARDGEATARATAEKARDEVARTREELARVEYGRTMEVAHQHWRDNHVPATLALLEGTRPDLRGWEWRYVDRLCHSDLHTLKGHKGRLLRASFSPDGSKVLTIGTDKTAKVWDTETGVEVFTLRGDTFVDPSSFSPDGTRILTPIGENAKVWDAKTGAELLTLTLKGHRLSASFSPDGSRVLTVGDNTAKVWNAETGAEICTFVDNGLVSWSSLSPDGAPLFSPDGSRVITHSSDLTARVWDAKTGAEVHTLKGHTRPIWCSSFSPDGVRIVTAGWDTTVKVWDARTGSEIHTIRGHTAPVMSASFSPDGSRILSSGKDMTARVWDARTGAELLTLKGHTDQVPWASFSRDGSRIVTASNDETARVWDAAAEVEARSLKGRTGDVFSAFFSPDGSQVLTTSDDKTAKVWHARTATVAITLKGRDIRCKSASFSPDGSRIVTVGGPIPIHDSRDTMARVWDARSGAEVLTLKGHADVVLSASFSPDGSRIVTGSRDRTARVWDARTGATILTIKGQAGSVVSSSFSPDGSRILTSLGEGDFDGDSSTSVRDARTGAELLGLKGHTNGYYAGFNAAAFSPDGTRIVTASMDNSAKLWDARSGVEVLTLQGDTSVDSSMLIGPVVWSASFSPDGTRIVTANANGTVKIWDAAPINREFLARDAAPAAGTVK